MIWNLGIILIYKALVLDAYGDICKDSPLYMTYGSGITCCNGTSIYPGIYTGDSKNWAECGKPPINEHETYAASMWRVYACLVKKSSPIEVATINLSKFAELMSSNYPNETKTEVKAGVDAMLKTATNNLLGSEVELTDYVNISKIRGQYYNVEKKVCGELDSPSASESEDSQDQSNTCQDHEARDHQSSRCCGNTTIPQLEHLGVSYSMWDGACDKTLKPLLDRMGLNGSDLSFGITHCLFACYLVEKSLLPLDKLMNVTVDDDIAIDNIVLDLIPPFLSKDVKDGAKSLVRKNFNATHILKDTVPNSYLGERYSHEDLYGCFAYQEIVIQTAFAHLYICNPADPKLKRLGVRSG